jgi:hypothetical protein
MRLLYGVLRGDGFSVLGTPEHWEGVLAGDVEVLAVDEVGKMGHEEVDEHM